MNLSAVWTSPQKLDTKLLGWSSIFTVWASLVFQEASRVDFQGRRFWRGSEAKPPRPSRAGAIAISRTRIKLPFPPSAVSRLPSAVLLPRCRMSVRERSVSAMGRSAIGCITHCWRMLSASSARLTSLKSRRGLKVLGWMLASATIVALTAVADWIAVAYILVIF